MKVSHSTRARVRERQSTAAEAIARISEKYLRTAVATIAIPRHAIGESANNRKVRDWIRGELESFDYDVELQGQYSNVVARPRSGGPNEPLVLVGAHYDSVPKTPGADDNASAVAAMLACARSLSMVAPEAPVC